MRNISYVELEVCDFGFGLLVISDVFFFHFAEFFISMHFNHSVCVELHAPLNLQGVFFFKKQRGFAKPSTKSRPFLQSLLNELLWDEMEMANPLASLEAFWQKKSISWDFNKGWLALFCRMRNVVECLPIFWKLVAFLRSLDDLPFDELP